MFLLSAYSCAAVEQDVYAVCLTRFGLLRMIFSCGVVRGLACHISQHPANSVELSVLMVLR